GAAAIGAGAILVERDHVPGPHLPALRAGLADRLCELPPVRGGRPPVVAEGEKRTGSRGLVSEPPDRGRPDPALLHERPPRGGAPGAVFLSPRIVVDRLHRHGEPRRALRAVRHGADDDHLEEHDVPSREGADRNSGTVVRSAPRVARPTPAGDASQRLIRFTPP